MHFALSVLKVQQQQCINNKKRINVGYLYNKEEEREEEKV